METLSLFIFDFIQGVFWIVLIWFSFAWLISQVFPKANWPKNLWRKTIRLFLIAPFKKLFRISRWLVTKSFATHREFHYRQMYLEEYQVSPLELYEAIQQAFLQRQIIQAQV